MNDDERKTSDYLKSFALRPAPPELRQRALAAAEGTRGAGRFLTPGQWRMAAVCFLFVITALAGDSILSGKQARRLDALLDGRTAAAWSAEADRSDLAELVGMREARTMRSLLTRPLPVRASLAEGRIVGNFLAFEEKEDAYVHSKNPR